MRIAVCVKQLQDSPTSLHHAGFMPQVSNIPKTDPTINEYDLNALEAGLHVKDQNPNETTVDVLSVGNNLAQDIMKKTVAMGADELILVDDVQANTLDAWGTMRVLKALLTRGKPYDIILCGRQASDWDQAHVPLLLSEAMELPCVTHIIKLQVNDKTLVLDRIFDDGTQTIRCPIPAIITVTSEFGQPRYPTLHGIMSVGNAKLEILTLSQLEIPPESVEPRVKMYSLDFPKSKGRAQLIPGINDTEKGHNLALRLRQEKLI